MTKNTELRDLLEAIWSDATMCSYHISQHQQNWLYRQWMGKQWLSESDLITGIHDLAIGVADPMQLPEGF